MRGERSLIAVVFLMTLCASLIAQDQLTLSAPRLSHAMAMMSDTMPVLTADFRMEGAVLHYSTDGTEPETHSPVLGNALPVRFPCTVKVRAFHPDFAPSPAAEAVFLLPGKEIKTLETSPPHVPYDGEALILADHMFGNSQFRQGYLGFKGDTVSIKISMAPWQVTRRIHLSGLVNSSAWITLPREVLIVDKDGRMISKKAQEALTEGQNSKKWHMALDIPPDRYGQISALLPPVLLPDWHQGAGTPGWLFLDEVWIE